jgi:MFS superfamily sulfate permease-like transporter
MDKNQLIKPKDGIAGLRENALSDATAGFVVFLLALPLSLGIAKASEFPPLMGLITAMVGGLVVSYFSGSHLSIKGPAAGLIVIVVGAVTDFGGGEQGWRYTLGALVVAGLLQVLFGVFKLGKLIDFFPLSAVQGMLAAIGIIIISKQIPVLLGVDPMLSKGLSPLALLGYIPKFIGSMDPQATLVGLVCLSIMLIWPFIDHPIRRMPAPLAVLLFAVPAAMILSFKHTEPAYSLVYIGDPYQSLGLNVSFGGWAMPATFIKYVLMFAVVGTLESLLTVKAVDIMDPYKRKSDPNKDLIAVGLGNTFTAIIGGLPMISEVARSSANVSNGGRTRWSNFFHGLFLLVFVLAAVHLIEMIPNTALAAMLITVGIRLAHPREFVSTFRIGLEQLIIFVVTIFVTLSTDLLLGIGAGIITEILFNVFNGKPLSALFKAPTEVSFNQNKYSIKISKAAVFSNYLGIKRKLDAIPLGANVEINLYDTQLVDYSVMENLHRFQRDYEANGGRVIISGLEDHQPVSEHHSAGRKKISED